MHLYRWTGLLHSDVSKKYILLLNNKTLCISYCNPQKRYNAFYCPFTMNSSTIIISTIQNKILPCWLGWFILYCDLSSDNNLHDKLQTPTPCTFAKQSKSTFCQVTIWKICEKIDKCNKYFKIPSLKSTLWFSHHPFFFYWYIFDS